MERGSTVTQTRCRTCETELPAGFRFCPSCGTQVQSDALEVRKTVTLLFCDVSGSTALGEQLDPEVLRSLMGDYFAIAEAAVVRHGGTVEKFVGDAVLAVFGIPVVREDDALRAVRAAAELRAGLADLAKRVADRNGVRLAIRTGVNTGEVVAGTARAGGSFATGDAVNTAARLEQAAPAGEVLLGASTYRLVRDAVVAKAVAPLAVKGKATPLEAFQLVEVLDVDEGRTRRTDARLVGRERERRALDEALERVVADRRCQMVTLLGPAGMGKTRLLADFETSLDPQIRILRGRCLSYGRGITFWPIVSVLRQAAGLTATQDPATARAALSEVLVGLPEALDVVERLAPLLGLGGEPGGTEETFWAVRLLLEHLADSGPVLVVIDDLHWAEAALLDLLEQLRDEARDVPLLLICPARPELLEQRPGWGGGAVSATTLMLEPLSGSNTQELLDDLLGPGLPAAVAEAVNGWGDGNPLFLEEVAVHLVEEGVLVNDDAGWSLRRDLAAVPVPPTVTALLTARLDRLPAPERSLLEHASVVGVEVTAEEAAALSEDPQVPALLARLVRKGLLRRVRSLRGEAFSFRHVLVREAAYEALPKAQRASLHERYADRLSGDGAEAGGEVDAFVGHHLESAVRLRRVLSPGSPEGEALAVRAADVLAAAAERARQADDLPAAEQLYLRSLDLLGRDAPTRRRRLLQLAWTLGGRWRITPALAAVDEALALAPEGAPDLLHLALLAERASLQMAAGDPVDPADARRLGAEAAQAAREAGDALVLSHALAAQITADQMLARWNAVFTGAEELLQTGMAAERREAGHLMLGAALYGSKPFPELLVMVAEEFEAVAQTAGMRAHLHGLKAGALAGVGRSAEARSELATARGLLEESGKLQEGPWGFMAPEILLADGDDVGAIEALRFGIEGFRCSGGLGFASTLLGLLAILLVQRGEDEAARATVEEADACTSPYDVLSVALVLCARALLTSRAGDHQGAAELTARALAVIDGSDVLMSRGDLYRWLAEVPAARGDRTEQRRMLAQAHELYVAKGHLPFADEANRLLAELA